MASRGELQTAAQIALIVTQRPAAVRHLFDWRVIGQLALANPAAPVRGPGYSARSGKTPVLDAAEARQILDAINASTPVCLLNRALILLMVFSFARVGAALAIRVADGCMAQRRLWVRLREKGGKGTRDAMSSHARIVPARLPGALEQRGDRGRRQGVAVDRHITNNLNDGVTLENAAAMATMYRHALRSFTIGATTTSPWMRWSGSGWNIAAL